MDHQNVLAAQTRPVRGAPGVGMNGTGLGPDLGGGGGGLLGLQPPQNIKDHTHTPLQKQFSAVLVCTKPIITQ